MSINYGKKLDELREKKKISQSILAERTNASQSAVSNYLKIEEPPLEWMKKALNVLSPETKLFEFVAEPEDLEKYKDNPSWILPEDLEMLRALYDLPLETRIKIRKLWIDSVEIAFDLKKN